MSKWFIDHRQAYIAAMLRKFGQVNRHQLVEKFDISMPQASADIQRFTKENPDVLIYDGNAKAYVVNEAAVSEDA